MSSTLFNHIQNALMLVVFLMASAMYEAQTTITPHHYEATYCDNNNCYNYEYDLTMPFVWETWDGDIRQKINAEVVRIGQELRMFNMNDDNCGPNFYPNPDTCVTPIFPESTVMEYTVHTNDAKIFSMSLNEEWIASSDGHGSMNKMYCFNVNLQTNSFITLDSIYNPAEKETALHQMMDRYYKANPEFDRGDGDDKYLGFVIEKGKTVFFMEHTSGPRSWVMRVD